MSFFKKKGTKYQFTLTISAIQTEKKSVPKFGYVNWKRGKSSKGETKFVAINQKNRFEFNETFIFTSVLGTLHNKRIEFYFNETDENGKLLKQQSFCTFQLNPSQQVIHSEIELKEKKGIFKVASKSGQIICFSLSSFPIEQDVMDSTNTLSGVNSDEEEEVEEKEEEKKELERKELERKENERKELERKEQEKKELERKEQERKELEKKEFEKKELERKEREKKEQEKREAEKREIERKEAEKKELERKEQERKELERKEQERRDLQRREIERREQIRKEQERRDALRKEQERKELIKREIEKRENERKEQERREIERREMELEIDRRVKEKLDHKKKIMVDKEIETKIDNHDLLIAILYGLISCLFNTSFKPFIIYTFLVYISLKLKKSFPIKSNLYDVIQGRISLEFLQKSFLWGISLGMVSIFFKSYSFNYGLIHSFLTIEITRFFILSLCSNILKRINVFKDLNVLFIINSLICLYLLPVQSVLEWILEFIIGYLYSRMIYVDESLEIVISSRVFYLLFHFICASL